MKSFFNLFDWNKRSKKKKQQMSVNGAASQGDTMEERKSDGTLPAPECGKDDDVVVRSMPSFSGGRDCGRGLLVVVDGGNGTKAPGVVARLMGLDYLPLTVDDQSCGALLGGGERLLESCYQEKCSEDACEEQCDGMEFGDKVSCSSLLGLKVEEMQSGLIESYIPITCNKSLSSSSDGASRIVNSTAVIILPSSRGSSSARRRESHQNLVEPSNVKRLRDQPLEKCSYVSQVKDSFRDFNRKDGDDAKSKGRTSSRALQPKAKIQEKADSNMGQDEGRYKPLSKNQSFSQRKEIMRKGMLSNSSGVLQQNSLNQNTMVRKDGLWDRHVVYTKPHAKSLPLNDDISLKNKATYRCEASFKPLPGKECEIGGCVGNEASALQVISHARQKKSTHGGNHVRKNGLSNDDLMSKIGKHIQHNVIVDDKPLQGEEGAGMDVVSFTFKSPMVKSASAMSARTLHDREGGCCPNRHGYWMGGDEDAKNKASATVELNVISGDALNLLLEQKLWELTSRLKSSLNDCFEASMGSLSSPHDELCSPEKTGMKNEFEPGFICIDEDQISKCSNPVGWDPDNPQEGESLIECGVHRGKEIKLQRPSPSYVLHACLSNETRSSSGHFVNANEVSLPSCLKTDHPSDMDGKPHVKSKSNTDSAVSSFHAMNDGREGILKCCQTNHSRAHECKIDYLEEKRSKYIGYCGTDTRWNRKLLFDYASEDLDVHNICHFRAGSHSSANDQVLLEREPAGEIYQKVLIWKCLGERTVDDFVVKDMSGSLGRWVDFRTNVFEAILEIEEEALDTLINEMVSELLV